MLKSAEVCTTTREEGDCSKNLILVLKYSTHLTGAFKCHSALRSCCHTFSLSHSAEFTLLPASIQTYSHTQIQTQTHRVSHMVHEQLQER